MPDCLENSPAVSSSPHRFQFSLRSLLLFSLAIALFFAGIFNTYNFVRYLMLLACQAFLFYVFLVWAIYGRGYLRTFGIGASLSFLFPWLITGFFWFFVVVEAINSSSPSYVSPVFGTKSWEDGIDFFWPSTVALILLVDSLFTGGTMVFARWLLDRSRRGEQAKTEQTHTSSACISAIAACEKPAL